MQFYVAVADPDAITAQGIVHSVQEAVQSIPYMINRTNITIFSSLKECEEKPLERRNDSGPAFNVVFANTDSLLDYAPIKKMGPFTPVIKVSAELDFELMFLKQLPPDFMTFPLDPALISRALRSCCAMNRLSSEYITAMQHATTISPVLVEVSVPFLKQRRPYTKRKPVARSSARTPAVKNVLRQATLKSSTPAVQNPFTLDVTMPINDDGFTNGLINPETGSDFPSLVYPPVNAIATEAAPVEHVVPGKLLVSLCPVTLSLSVVKADAVAVVMFDLPNNVSNLNMTSLFGFTTDHNCVNDIQLYIRQNMPLNRYITLYTMGWKRPIPVYLTLTPIVQRSDAWGSSPGYAIMSILDAGSVGWLKMQANGFGDFKNTVLTM